MFSILNDKFCNMEHVCTNAAWLAVQTITVLSTSLHVFTKCHSTATGHINILTKTTNSGGSGFEVV